MFRVKNLPKIVLPNVGNGACFFRSISYNLFINQERYQKIRNTLKAGTLIILLRNPFPPKLCNSTSMYVDALRKSQTEAKIITGPAKGE